MAALHPVSELLMRNTGALKGRVLLINPPADGLATELSGIDPVTRLCLFSQFYDDHRYHLQLLNDGIDAAYADAPPEPAEAWNTGIIFHAREKGRSRRLVQQTSPHMQAGGRLLLVGENRAGAKSAGRLLEPHTTGLEKLDAARHCVLFSGECPGETSSSDGDSDWSDYQLALPSGSLRLFSLPGVFSAGEPDPGTRMLLERLSPPEQGRALDFGCGCGVLAAAMKQRQEKLDVVAVDRDAPALAATRRSLAENGLEARVHAADGWHGIDGDFDFIVTNPPFHRGVNTHYQTTETFLKQARDRLRPGGEMQLVANAFLDYPRLLESLFGHCEVLASDRRYRVYRVKRRHSR